MSDGRAATAWSDVLQHGTNASSSHLNALSRSVFWSLAELCDEFGLPFDLMIGVNRGVYANGVFQGQDLYDSRVSLIQYRELFNAFPQVKFPISVLASVTNQELVSYAWIFPNVITNGHWWYSNTPSFIARDAAARLEAVPQTKQIAYYSDAYKLEFVWPKFDMYRHVLSGILADHFVKGNGWSEERAIELGRQVLRDNVDEIFPRPEAPTEPSMRSDSADASFSTVIEETAKADDSWTIQDSDDELANSETVTFETVVSTDSLDDLDPLPSHDEIQSANVDDVELRPDISGSAPDATSLESEIDAEPLDVGDLSGDEGAEESEIRMLRGEGSFEPDEDSLRVQPDPVTGELKFPVDDDPNATQQGD